MADAISEPTDYGFVSPAPAGRYRESPAASAAGRAIASQTIFYIHVPDVEAALQKAESLGGTRQLGPERAPTGLVIGHFTDPAGNLVGVAGG